jgi:acid phosphatase (class A)
MKKIFALFVVLFFYNFQVFAKPYFDPKVISPTMIDPPFEMDSEECSIEIKAILKMQENADQKEIENAANERNLNPSIFLAKIRPEINKENSPKLYHLLERVQETSLDVTENAKNFWKRKRPYILNKNVKALIEGHDNPSYPSGHTTGSYVYAHVLGQLFPKERALFIERAEEIAQHRVLVGMHFQEDLKGGRQLALLLAGALFENTDFQKDFAAAKKELEKN